LAPGVISRFLSAPAAPGVSSRLAFAPPPGVSSRLPAGALAPPPGVSSRLFPGAPMAPLPLLPERPTPAPPAPPPRSIESFSEESPALAPARLPPVPGEAEPLRCCIIRLYSSVPDAFISQGDRSLAALPLTAAPPRSPRRSLEPGGSATPLVELRDSILGEVPLPPGVDVLPPGASAMPLPPGCYPT